MRVRNQTFRQSFLDRITPALLVLGRRLRKPTLVTMAIVAVLFSWRFWCERSARQSAGYGHHATVGRLLTPWFRLGLLGEDSTHLLMQSLLTAEFDPKLALEVAEECVRRYRAVECALAVPIAHMQMGHLEEADHYLRTLLPTIQHYPGLHFELAQAARKSGNMELAINEYVATIGFTEKPEESREPTRRLVELLNSAGRYAEAVKYGEALVGFSQQDWPDGLYDVAESYLGMKDDARFLAVMKTAVALRNKLHREDFDPRAFPRIYAHYFELIGAPPPPAAGSTSRIQGSSADTRPKE